MRRHWTTSMRLAAACATVFVGNAYAVTYTWDGGGADNNITTANNWVGNVAPTNSNPPFTASLTFTGVVKTTPVFDTDFHVGLLTFDSNASLFNLNGPGKILLHANINHDDNTTQTINAPIELQSSIDLNLNSTGSLTLANINLGVSPWYLTVRGNAPVNFTGTISGSGSLDFQSTSTVTIGGTAANTYSSPFPTSDFLRVSSGLVRCNKPAGVVAVPDDVSISGGEVELLASDQIAASSEVRVSSTGLLDLNNNNETISALRMAGGAITTGTGTLTLDGTFDVGKFPTAISTIAGKVSLAGGTRTLTVTDNDVEAVILDISAVISNGALIKQGVGIARLSGANTMSSVSVQGGSLRITNNAAFGSCAGAGPCCVTAPRGACRRRRRDQDNRTAPRPWPPAADARARACACRCPTFTERSKADDPKRGADSSNNPLHVT